MATSTQEEQEISRNRLKLLINGYVRAVANTGNRKVENIPDIINYLCKEYYAKQEYIILLNSETLQLTFFDTSKSDVTVSPKKLIKLNEIDPDLNTGRHVGVCYQKDIKSNNLCSKITEKIPITANSKIDAIFKYGGNEEDCCVLLYDTDDIDNVYYFQLPSLPFTARNTNPCYSDIYGLIGFGQWDKTGTIAILNMKDLKWTEDKLPEDVFEQDMHMSFTPCCCIINEKEVFFAHGGNSDFYSKKVGIYDLETKKCKILNENNPFEATESSVVYCNNNNIAYIGGAPHIRRVKQIIRCYDLNKNMFSRIEPYTNEAYDKPTMYINKSGTILSVAGIESWSSGQSVFSEFIDLRAPHKWINNENFVPFSEQFFQKNDVKNVSVVGWM